MKVVRQIPELSGDALTFNIERFSDDEARDLLGRVISKAREVISVVSSAYQEEWKNNPSTGIRAVFGHWLVQTVRHFAAVIILCEEDDLSVVANTHHRQIFELFLQVRYFASVDQDTKEILAQKIPAIGYIEYLEKLSVIKDHKHIKDAYDEIKQMLELYDDDLIQEIITDRKNRKYNWFGRSFSQLAKDISRNNEDLRSTYQIISADIHGIWDLSLDVRNPEPGVLDFRGYPDKATLFIRATELVDQVTTLFIKLWNEIAESVGAECVYYYDED